MGISPGDFFQRHRPFQLSGDSFDLIRLAAAFSVFWSHQHALTGRAEPIVPLLQTTFGGLGVAAFFAISGYLNAKSVMRRQSSLRFVAARALRIYPALVVCLLVTVAYCAFATTQPGAAFNAATIRYLASNIFMFVRPLINELPGIFENAPFGPAINGSLWTIPIELIMYTALAVALLRKSLFLTAVVAAAAMLLALEIGNVEIAAFGKFWRPFLQLASLFFVGVLAAISPLAIAAVVIAAFASMLLGNDVSCFRFLFGLLILAAGHLPLPQLIRPTHDISYGFYLYAFPCQQISASYTTEFWPSLAIAAGLTLSLAWLSCLLIEEPALKLRRYVYAQPETAQA